MTIAFARVALLCISFLACIPCFADAPSTPRELRERRRAIEALVQALPDVNPDADPDLLKAVGQAALSLPFQDCEYKPADMDFMDHLIEIFEEGRNKPEGSQYSYIAGELDKLAQLDFAQRTKLKGGARLAPDMTIASLKNRNCRAHIRNIFLMGASKAEILAIIHSSDTWPRF